MPVDLSVVATFLLMVLVLVYAAALGALVMWLGKADEPAVVPATGERSALRQAA
jgi:flagellar basal body-associated protein FliL